MKDWLAANQPLGGRQRDHDDHGADHADMPGMLTPEQLDELAGLSGRDFDRYFLQAMINHHDGAIMMVQALLEGGEGGQETTIFQLASHIASDQAVEIAAMKRELVLAGGRED